MRKLAGKPLQRVSGYFNYYHALAGQFHSVINRIITRRDKRPFLKWMLQMAAQDFIHFRPPGPPVYATIHTDASLCKITAINTLQIKVSQKTYFKPILENELRAALLGLKLFERTREGENSLVLQVDNKAVVALINSGTCRWNIDVLK